MHSLFCLSRNLNGGNRLGGQYIEGRIKVIKVDLREAGCGIVSCGHDPVNTARKLPIP